MYDNCVCSIFFAKLLEIALNQSFCNQQITYFEIQENPEIYDAYDHHWYEELEKHREHSVPANIKYKQNEKMDALRLVSVSGICENHSASISTNQHKMHICKYLYDYETR